jgi:hypothetical protein
MRLDITTILRRLVLAGIPTLGAGCVGEVGSSAEQAWAAARAECTQTMLLPGSSKGPIERSLAIAADDGRWGDFFEACTGEGDYCRELCQAVMDTAAPPEPSTTHSLTGCTLDSCSYEGKRVVHIAYDSRGIASVGRRPAGFADAAHDVGGTAVGRWLAATARLEGASVPAFAQLARELRAHGAPEALVRRARRARADEVRHFRIMRALARRHGADAAWPSVRLPAVRPLAEIAEENAAEGCVRETFGAMVALWQAQHAGDRRIRTASARIAEDELSHAQLAWDVDAWARARLGDGAALDHARREAARDLIAGLAASPVAPDLVATAGLPDAVTGAALARTLAPALWVQRSAAADPVSATS